MKALLMLEDGCSSSCESFTGEGEVFGEMVFHTGLTGYQEIITDPSYQGQIVLMTAPMVGNYGVRDQEDESSRIHTEGFVVKEYAGEELNPEEQERLSAASGSSLKPSFDRMSEEFSPVDFHNKVIANLAGYLSSQGVLGVEGVDTRFLTKHIRAKGAMKAGITTRTLDKKVFLDRVRRAPGLIGRDLVKEVTTGEPYLYSDGGGYRIAVLDCGIKRSILRELAKQNCRVEVFPAAAAKSDILKMLPDGILLSNGPGDPAALKSIVGLVESLIGEVPVFGICLGHQLIGQALGARTYKLKFGHHGGNHPVRDERTKKIHITSQNHGFAVDTDTLNKKEIEVTFINLNDYTLEGMKHRKYPLFSVQFHPEAGPGPHDTLALFDEFLTLIRESRRQ